MKETQTSLTLKAIVRIAVTSEKLESDISDE